MRQMMAECHPVATTIPELAAQIGRLVEEKRAAYGGEDGRDGVECVEAIMRVWFPDGIPPDRLRFATVATRILDKMTRLAHGDPEAFSESPYVDIVGYCLRELIDK